MATKSKKTAFEVRLKAGHPTGVYHRAGLTFSASAPVVLEDVPTAVQNDPWLIVSEISSPSGGESEGDAWPTSRKQT